MGVLGFDSRYTTTIPSSTNYKFAGIKISQADGFGPYSQPLIQWERAGELGLDRLPFHFWRWGGDEHDGVEQAEWFWRVYEENFLPMGEAELPPVLDIEDRFSAKGLHVVRNIMNFLHKTEELWGRRPMVYSAGWWFDGWVKPYTHPGHEIYTYDLWEADPPPDTPIGYWSESMIIQVKLDFPKPGFTAEIDENVADEEWYEEQTQESGGDEEPTVHEVTVPANADHILIIRE